MYIVPQKFFHQKEPVRAFWLILLLRSHNLQGSVIISGNMLFLCFQQHNPTGGKQNTTYPLRRGQYVKKKRSTIIIAEKFKKEPTKGRKNKVYRSTILKTDQRKQNNKYNGLLVNMSEPLFLYSVKPLKLLKMKILTFDEKCCII